MERVISSSLKQWGPWAAASVAAHALLLFGILNYTEFSTPAAQAGMQVVLVELPMLGKPEAESVQSIAEPKPMLQSAARPAAKHSAPSVPVIDRRESMVSADAADNGISETGPEPQPLQATAASSQEENRLAVRQHLERFKYYPAAAKRRGIEGVVEVSFDLDDEGRASMLLVTAGSGYNMLDQAALQTVRRAEPFPVSGGSYRFRLLFRRS